MAVTSQSKHLYEFGPFRMDTCQRLLMRNEEVVPVTPKAFDTLLVLVERSGRVVEKSELMNLLWPDTFVEEGNLTFNISTLRKALGKNSENGQYIETIPRRGYRFVASVCEVKTETADSTTAEDNRWQAAANEQETEAKTESQWWHKKTLVSFMVPSGLAIALATFWIWQTRVAPGNAERIGSIAVLPLKQLGTDKDQDYLGAGIADSLVIRLNKLERLVVRPTSSVLKYSATGQDPERVGRDLKVDAVLDGRFQRMSDRIRVTLELLRIADSRTLWAEGFEEDFSNIFAMQDSIAEKVVQVLSLKLTGEEQRRLTKRYTENAEAYQFYLRGRYLWNKRTGESVKKSIGYFDQAIEKDPNYALAYDGLADAYYILGAYGAIPTKEFTPKAKAAALRALQIDDTLSEALTTLATITASYDWDWPEAERQFRKALESNPNYATAHQWYAEYLARVGRLEEAVAEARRAQELDPASPLTNGIVGTTFYRARQYDRAAEQLEKTLDMDPDFASTHLHLGMTYVQTKRYEKALSHFRRLRTLWGSNPQMVAVLGYGCAVAGEKSRAQEILEELSDLSKRQYVSPLAIALVYTGLDEKDQAFSWIEKAYEDRVFWLGYLKVEPFFDPLRSDPRFTSLLTRMHLN
jgi:DNA-binding winged helix-turn-helix (wHTH) protein/TolB-like protein/Flp pilus assembly protein TadD